MPIDFEPTADGNLALTIVSGVRRVDVVDVDEPITRYRAHFATCPDAQKWRRKPEGAPPSS